MGRKITISRIIQNVFLLLMAGILLTGIFSIRLKAKESIDDKITVVSLGDSYSSGEGVTPFYGQDEGLERKLENPDWLAHRSKASWPGMLKLSAYDKPMSEYKDVHWFFVAASGAVTDNLKYTQEKEYKKGKYKGFYYLKPQLDIFDQLDENSVDYVTLTIGGNDIGFTDIIKECVLGSKFLNIGHLSDMLNNSWDKFLVDGGIKTKIKDTYHDIALKAGKQASIIVAGYPCLLDEDGGGVFFSKQEAAEVNYNVHKFNIALNQIVMSCQKEGMDIEFVPVEKAFEGHQADSKSEIPFINSIELGARDEDLLDVMLASAYSMHPNPKGVKAYADRVQKKIEEIEKRKNSEKNGETENVKATEAEKNASSEKFFGMVVQPEDVVLKMFQAFQKYDYKTVVQCLDPVTEQQLNFIGGVASKLFNLVGGEQIPWEQLFLDVYGATNLEIIDCYSQDMTYDSKYSLFSKWLPKIPGIRNLVCTEADVYVKFRYQLSGEYYTVSGNYHVRRYDGYGWRIEKFSGIDSFF